MAEDAATTLGVLIASILVGGCIAHRLSRRHPPETRWLAAVLPGAAMMTALALLRDLAGSLLLAWTGIRFAPALAMSRGFDLYSGPDSGPVLGTVYGPVKDILLLPACWLSAWPTTMLVAALLTILLVTLGPLALFVTRADRVSAPAPLLKAAALVAVVFAATRIKGLHMLSFDLHADAPAVGLGLLSCYLLITPESTSRRRWAAAGLAILAAWSKQLDVALAVAQLLYLWIAEGRREMWRHCCRLALGAIAVSAAVGAVFGVRKVIFNTVTVVGHHPWNLADNMVWHTLVSALTQAHLLALVVLAAALVEVRRWPQQSTAASLAHLARQPWFMPTLAAVVLLPVSILGHLKVGGDDNSFHFLYYLAAAAALAAVRLGGADAPPAARRWTHWGLAAVLAAATVLELPYTPELMARARYAVGGRVVHAQLIEIARARPGEIYFPWFPASTLLASGEAYHSEYGVWDRELAGRPLSVEHVRAHVPPEMRYIAYEYDCMRYLFEYYEERVPAYREASFYMVRRYFPEYSERVALPELPGWVVFTRPAVGPASPAETDDGGEPSLIAAAVAIR